MGGGLAIPGRGLGNSGFHAFPFGVEGPQIILGQPVNLLLLFSVPLHVPTQAGGNTVIGSPTR